MVGKGDMGMRGTLSACLAFLASAGVCLGSQAVMVDSNGVVVNPPRAAFMEANDVASKTWVEDNFQDSGESEVSVGFGLKGSGSSTNPVAVDPDVLPNGLDAVGFGLSGDGSDTNPLAVDPDVVVSATDRQIDAFLAWDGSGYVSTYGPRMPVDAFAAVAAHGAGAPMTFRPGALLDMSIAVDGARHVYICTQEFGTAVFATNDFTWLPSGASDSFWDLFARQGRTGTTGATGTRGTDGLDGIGDFRYGVWDNLKAYVYDTGLPVVVSYAGRWYDCVASSTGIPPNSAGATNWWRVSVSNGADGVVVGWTNLVDRGNWDSGASYSTNDAAWYQGNYFVVSPTNQSPGIGVPPAVDSDLIGVDSAFWHVLTKRGRRGLQGAPGDLVNSYTVYSLFGTTNTAFLNSPSATNRTPRWVSTAAGVLSMEWTPFAWLGSNILSSDGSNMFLNGEAVETGISEAEAEAISAEAIAPLLDGSIPCVDYPVENANTTVSLFATNKAYRVRASGAGTITNWVVSGVSTSAIDIVAVVLEPGGAVNFSWGPIWTNVSLPAANSTNIYFIWRGPVGNWAVD